MTTTLSSSLLTEKIVSAILSVCGQRPVALHEPLFAGNEWRYVKECLDTSFVSSVGRFVDRFEQELAEVTGAKRAIAVVNGTAALHIALRLVGVEPGDEVLVPALTFAATANAVVYCGAVPHFIDSEEATLGVDVAALRNYLERSTDQHNGYCVNRMTRRIIRAIVPMHTFGHPVDMAGVVSVARDFNIAVVEDAAESLGSFYQGQHTGTFGAVGTLSFNGNKTITTGGGGAILTMDEELGQRAKHLTTTAKVPHAWDYFHDDVGYNYRMPNLNAALGCAQLENLPSLVAAQRTLYGMYAEAFAEIEGVRLINEPPGCRSNFWLQAILLDEEHVDLRDALLSSTNAVGVKTRPVWRLMNHLPHFDACPRMPMPGAESIAARLINLPSSAFLARRS